MFVKIATASAAPEKTEMAKNRLTITHENDTIRLSWQRGQESTRFADAVPFQHPFDEEALMPHFSHNSG
ncbi:hypothetical protein [Aerosakkonema funiforme]|uniref:hypothetical protein n=1 Tax=Aerosakkonema funiforme TaxID=1246630 RepID=UPI0035B74D16